jgi:hypothetical protein
MRPSLITVSTLGAEAERGGGGGDAPISCNLSRHAFSPSTLSRLHRPTRRAALFCLEFGHLDAHIHQFVMAEKRKLPARAGREPAAKRRVSEAATPSQKKKAPTPRVPSPPTPPPPEPVEAPLPISIKDGEPVPVLRERQSATLSDKEYQSYAERFDPMICPDL